MFNIKIYDKNWVFKKTLSEKLINCSYSYSATVNGGFSGLTFEYFGDVKINHRDRVKIYKGNIAIYQGFVIGITKIANREGIKQVISCSGMIGVLAFMPYPNLSQTINPSQILRSLFSGFGGFDTSQIQEYHSHISIKSENLTYLGMLQEVLKITKDWGLFIDAENKVWFSPYSKSHTLTYGLDCFSIDITEDSSNYYNDIVLKYEKWEIEKKDESWIRTYGLNKIIVYESQIKDQTTANLRLQSLFQEKSLIKTYKIAVNNQYEFEKIKPWELITIKNTDHKIIRKAIKQIQYWQHSAVITLESYQSLEHFILQQ